MGRRRWVQAKWDFRGWAGMIALTLIGAATPMAGLSAQVPEEAAATEAAEPVRMEEFIGRWSGPFESDGPAGSLILNIARNGEEWRITCELIDDGAPAGEAVRAWVLQENRFSFLQWYDDIELSVRGRLVEGELIGEMEAKREGEQVGVATFRLQREVLPTPLTANP